MSETMRYFDLNKPARVRLAMMREAFANHAKRYPHCPEYAKPKSWRDIRGTTHKSVAAYCCAGLNQGFNGKDFTRVPVWYGHAGPQFRDERFAHECEGGPNHTGWHTLADGATYRDGTGLARGIVGRLPHGRYITGYWWGDNGERVYFADVFDDEREAARMADEHARVFAEDARDDNERFEAKCDAEDAEESARVAARLAVMARNISPDRRDIARQLLTELREARATLREACEAYEKG